jgi:hypothetical protein
MFRPEKSSLTYWPYFKRLKEMKNGEKRRKKVTKFEAKQRRLFAAKKDFEKKLTVLKKNLMHIRIRAVTVLRIFQAAKFSSFNQREK